MELLHYAYFAAALFTVFWLFQFYRKSPGTAEPAALSASPEFTRAEHSVSQWAAADRVFPESLGSHIPQDSILRRHFITHVRYVLHAVAVPYPTDSVLARHTEQLLEAEFADCLHDAARWEKLLADYRTVRAVTSASYEPVAESAPIENAAADSGDKEGRPEFPAAIPEDSVLRRHFLVHCRQMLEEMMSPAPSDSVLARHHDQLIQSRFEDCLRGGTHLVDLFERYAEHRSETHAN